MAGKPLPSPEVLRQLLRYEPDTGKLFWRERGPERFLPARNGSPLEQAARWNKRFSGKEAFTSTDSLGYRQSAMMIGGDRFQLRAHRVIWAMLTGAWPNDMVDHTNGDKQDNRARNLRAASASQNQSNRRPKGGSSKYIGVSAGKNGMWMAYVSAAGIRRKSRAFESEAAAASWRDQMAKRLHGKFARLNFPGGDCHD